MTDMQAQLDDLAAKVEGIDSHHKARLQGHDRTIGELSDAVDKMKSVLNKLTGTDWYAEPAPPAAPEPWGQEWRDARDAVDWDGDSLEVAVLSLVEAIERSKAPEQIITKNGATHRRLRHALLAAPADRAVVTDAMAAAAYGVWCNDYQLDNTTLVRKMIEAALRAAERGEGE